MNNRIKYYINIYLKRNAYISFGLAFPVAVLFLIVSIFYDEYAYDVFFTLMPFGFAGVAWCISALYVLRFIHLIRTQEKMFGISFGDTNAICCESTVYISEKWFICAGSCAFYRKYIKKISYKSHKEKGVARYRITIKTIDRMEYRFWLSSYGTVRRLYNWHKGCKNV